MSDQPLTTASGQPVPVIIRSDRYLSAYANGFTIRVSAVDSSLVFLQNSSLPTGQSILVEEGSVSMSLPVFKQLAMSLAAILPALEEVIGPIKIDASQQMTPAHLDALLGPIRNVKFTD